MFPDDRDTQIRSVTTLFSYLITFSLTIFLLLQILSSIGRFIPSLQSYEKKVSIALSYFSAHEDWGMYKSAPVAPLQGVKVIAQTKKGDEIVLDPLLPSFRRLKGFYRFQLFFSSIGFSPSSPYASAYLRQLCRALDAKGNGEFLSVKVMINGSRFNVRSKRSDPWEPPQKLVQIVGPYSCSGSN